MIPAPLIAPTQSTKTLDPTVIGERVVTYQIIGTLDAGEKISFNVEDGVGGWRPLSIDDEVVELVLGNDQVTFYGPSYVKIVKSATAALVGLRAVSV